MKNDRYSFDWSNGWVTSVILICIVCFGYVMSNTYYVDASEPERLKCEEMDTDADGDIDLADYRLFMMCMTGPGTGPE